MSTSPRASGLSPLTRLTNRIIAQLWAQLSYLERVAGHYPNAELYARKALALALPSTAPGDRLRIALWGLLGKAHECRGLHEAAEHAYACALRELHVRRPSDAFALAALYRHLGVLQHGSLPFPKSDVLALHGLALRVRALGDEHVDVARDLEVLAADLQASKRSEVVFEIAEEAVAISARGMVEGPPEPVMATAKLSMIGGPALR